MLCFKRQRGEDEYVVYRINWRTWLISKLKEAVNIFPTDGDWTIMRRTVGRLSPGIIHFYQALSLYVTCTNIGEHLFLSYSANRSTL